MVGAVIGDCRGLGERVSDDEQFWFARLHIAILTKSMRTLRTVHGVHSPAGGCFYEILRIPVRCAPSKPRIKHNGPHSSRGRFGEGNVVAQKMDCSNGQFTKEERRNEGYGHYKRRSCKTNSTPVHAPPFLFPLL